MAKHTDSKKKIQPKWECIRVSIITLDAEGDSGGGGGEEIFLANRDCCNQQKIT